MDNTKHKDLIKKYYNEYKKIGHIECPAFGNEKVYFNKKGFRHLIYKNNDRRSDYEYIRRLGLIKYSSNIVKNSMKYTELRKMILNEDNVYFWSLEKIIDNVNIILIIRQINNKPKHFFSIMYKR
jgi:hypothetical protein